MELSAEDHYQINSDIDSNKILELVKKNEHFYDLFLEYQVQYNFMSSIVQIHKYAPNHVLEFAKKKCDKLDSFLSNSMKKSDLEYYKNNFHLNKHTDFAKLYSDLPNPYVFPQKIDWVT